jgi:M6 family metalloprotease-like protein
MSRTSRCCFLLPALVALAIAAGGSAAAFAADPPPADTAATFGAARPHSGICTDDGRVDPALVRDFRYRLAMLQLGITDPPRLIPEDIRGLPSTGNVRIFALLIDFSDWFGKNDALKVIHPRLFANGTDPADYPYESVRNYYQRSSYGLLNLSGDVLGWWHYPGPRSAVPQTDAGRQALIAQALQSYDPWVDFSKYDNDHDGYIDYFIVDWAGPDNGVGSFWWGYKTSWSPTAGALTLDGVSPDVYSFQAECAYEPQYDPEFPNAPRTTKGLYDQIVVMHETGHALGLPDYYGPTGGVGGIDMMHLGIGDHNCFSKWLLGWLTPTPISWVTRTRVLHPTGTSPSAFVVMPGASSADPYDEFYMVQNRQRVGNDFPRANDEFFRMPGDGLLIWHVDAHTTPDGLHFLYRNTEVGRKLLKLMEADGKEHIEKTFDTTNPPYGWAQADDYYVVGSTFGPTTTPNSSRYDGTPSGVEVKDIATFWIPLPSTSANGTQASGAQELVTGALRATLVGGPDHTAPSSTASGYRDVWYSTPVAVTLTATDTGGSGLLRTEYSLNFGASWVAGSSLTIAAPANGSNDGYHFVLYRAVDVAENVESPHIFYVKIDTVPPVTSCDAPSGWVNHDVVVHLTATDNGAGVISTMYRLNDGSWADGTEATISADLEHHTTDGANTLRYYSTDALGRAEAVKTKLVRIDTRRPTPVAPTKVRCTSGGQATLPYKVLDTAPNGGWANVRIKLRNAAGTVVAQTLLRHRSVNKLLGLTFACKLRPGVYTFWVYATDAAGNTQLKPARNSLKVKGEAGGNGRGRGHAPRPVDACLPVR